MAQIFKASAANGKIYSLKKILGDYSSNPDFIRMFLEEAQICLNLKHPHIIRVFDFGQVDGNYYLAMEYVFGRDMGNLLRTCAERRIYIPVDVACFIILQCCRGLEYAHSLTDSFGKRIGIIHRDISPPNILLSYNGEAKILDFGIAKVKRSGGATQTRSGVLKGKFCYMSPEQASGKELSPQSDVFSLGIVFHELLTSRSLFYSDDEMITLERVRRADVKAPSKLRRELPPELDKIALKALSLKLKNRYQNCAEMGESLRAFLKKYYPRTDARSVAKFVRSIFPEDFKHRLKVSESEGWKDTLVVGHSDDELMLDRSSLTNEVVSTRKPAFEEVGWLSRMLYDPKHRDRIDRYGFRLLLLLILLGSVIAAVHLNTIPKIFNALLESGVNSSTPPLAVVKQGSSESPIQTPPVGSFQYWIERAEQAESKQNHEEAVMAYEKAERINSFDLRVLTRKNFNLLALGSSTEACPWFEKQKEIPLEDQLLADAICREHAGDLGRALVSYQDFLRKFPQEKRAKDVRQVIQYLHKKLQ